MPSITNSGALNELDPEHIPDRSGEVDESEGPKEEKPSAGTSSSTSGRKPGKSGPSGTPGHPWPAPDAESPSGKDQQASTQPSYSASLTDGSTQGTGPSPARQQGSSEGSAAQTPPTPAPDPSSLTHDAMERGEAASVSVNLRERLPEDADDPSAGLSEAEREAEARSLVASAHQAYVDKNYDLAEGLLSQAEELLPEIRSETAQAREAIADRRAESQEG